jgi:putative membrane protein
MRSENRGLLIVLGVLLLIVLLMPMLGVGMMGPGGMGGYWAPGSQPSGWSWSWGLAMGLGMLAMLAFWGALIVGVVLLVRWLMAATGGSSERAPETALEILRRRYAAGEITAEEYARMRQELEG